MDLSSILVGNGQSNFHSKLLNAERSSICQPDIISYVTEIFAIYPELVHRLTCTKVTRGIGITPTPDTTRLHVTRPYVACCITGLISDILAQEQDLHEQLLTWLEPHSSPITDWTRCIYGKPKNFFYQQFHEKCDYKSPTVTLVRVRDNIFGGFTTAKWGGKQA